MKITTFLIFIAFMQVSAKGLAQRLTLVKKDATIKQLFKEINKQTGYNIYWSDSQLNSSQKIDANFKDAPILDVLDKVLTGTKLTYTVENKTVVIKEKAATVPAQTALVQLVQISVSGRVTDSLGTPLIGATVSIRGSKHATITDEKGEFQISANTGDVLLISFVGYTTSQFTVRNANFQNIALLRSSNGLAEVVVSTGYQDLPQERATGSFEFIDSALINRSVSTNILDRLNGVTNSLIFNANASSETNQSAITIRGRSTINANPNPLIVLDGFPYDGDITNINPNDVENITILKDAAASSIWGAYSGNGVIVINTKKGKYNQPTHVSFNSNVTVTGKPNLYYTPQISSSDFINVEQYLFQQGNYQYYPNWHPQTPVIAILKAETNGAITVAQANDEINLLRGQDIRNDLDKYFYQGAVNQQYALNLSGGGNNDKYYFSTGYDKDVSSLVRDGNNRLSLSGTNTYSFLNHKLELTSNVTFTRQNVQNNNQVPSFNIYPYAKLADQNGNPLSVPTNYPQGYVDTAGHGLLKDWNYRPLQDQNLSDNTTTTTDYRLNMGLNYKIIKGLDFKLTYQYENGTTKQTNDYSPNSFYVRNLINSYSQINTTTNTVTTPIPNGGILDLTNNTITSNDGRAQVDYSLAWNSKNQLTAIGGAEVRGVKAQYNTYRQYGYNSDLESISPVNYAIQYPMYYQPFIQAFIPLNDSNLGNENNFISYFANASYAYDNKYTITASARKDESNIFGVNTNQKGVPLWSVGGSWEISSEQFYHIGFLPYLKLRVTDGYNGNVDNNVPAITTASSYNATVFEPSTLYLNNPPNANLSWEKVNTINFGLDFATSHNRIQGSFEYYIKKSTNLIAQAAIDPTFGVTTFTGNTANLNGKGIDVELHSVNTNGLFKWTTDLLYNYVTNTVTKYYLPTPNLSEILPSIGSSPIVGKPLYSIYSLKWAGLTDKTGDPQVYFNHTPSTAYSNILTSTDLSNLVYNGSAVPTSFGSIRNTFTYKQLSFSFNIKYELGYYFRRSSLNYGTLFTGNRFGGVDYNKRWQKPGDELITNVPSVEYSDDSFRDETYLYSNILVDNADNIRLQDLRLSYSFGKNILRKFQCQSIQVFLYANNVGLLWKANKDGIDPDFVPNGSGVIYPNPRSLSVGVNVGF